jgi:predicted nuclease of predicted toxin-antitoxin system
MSLLLYMDHHVDGRITAGLRHRGYEVLTAFEDGHDRSSDVAMLARAAELGRVVFTFDQDFLEIAADWEATGRSFAGIVYGRTQDLSIGEAVRDLELIVQAVSAEGIENTVIWIPL